MRLRSLWPAVIETLRTFPSKPTVKDAVPWVPDPVQVQDRRIVAAVQLLPEPQRWSARLTVMPMLTPPIDVPGTIAVDAGLGSRADAVAGEDGRAGHGDDDDGEPAHGAESIRAHAPERPR